MKAYGFFQANGQAQLIERETPTAKSRDLLIKIDAIAVNPVDTKIKASLGDGVEQARIIGLEKSVGFHIAILRDALRH